jgi:hypothetical protein
MQRCRHQLGDGHRAVAWQAGDCSLRTSPRKVAVLPSVGCIRRVRLRVQRCHHAGGLAVHFGTCALAGDWLTKSWIVGRPAQKARGGARPSSLAAAVTGARMGSGQVTLTAGQESHDCGGHEGGGWYTDTYV